MIIFVLIVSWYTVLIVPDILTGQPVLPFLSLLIRGEFSSDLYHGPEEGAKTEYARNVGL